ncbi:hypothetical protein FA13DRAFT_1723696, partial [Coprinellus micaceus]
LSTRKKFGPARHILKLSPLESNTLRRFTITSVCSEPSPAMDGVQPQWSANGISG